MVIKNACEQSLPTKPPPTTSHRSADSEHMPLEPLLWEGNQQSAIEVEELQGQRIEQDRLEEVQERTEQGHLEELQEEAPRRSTRLCQRSAHHSVINMLSR